MKHIVLMRTQLTNNWPSPVKLPFSDIYLKKKTTSVELSLKRLRKRNDERDTDTRKGVSKQFSAGADASQCACEQAEFMHTTT